MKVLAAIPCLNEEIAIGTVVLKARRHATEVLVVDDGSTDTTAQVARLAGATVITHPHNGGKGKAYQTLWQHALQGGYDRLVVLDGDGQHDADEIPLLLTQLDAGADLAIGARWGHTTQMPLWRKIGKRILDYGTAAATATGAKLTDSQSGYRAYNRKALTTITPRDAGFSIESQTLIDAREAGLHIAETRIHCRYDVDGSTQNPIRQATGVLNKLLLQIGIRRPLLTWGLPGMVALLFGLFAGGYSILLYRNDGTFAIGWVLIGMLSVIMGALGLFMGVMLNVLPRSVAYSLRAQR